MINFGPCIVTHNAVSLGDTFGGGSLRLNTQEVSLISNNATREKIILSGDGVINAYKRTAAITLAENTNLFDFNEVILDGGDRFKITLYSCKILVPEDLEVGTNTQKAFKLNLFFRHDTNGNIIKIE